MAATRIMNGALNRREERYQMRCRKEGVPVGFHNAQFAELLTRMAGVERPWAEKIADIATQDGVFLHANLLTRGLDNVAKKSGGGIGRKYTDLSDVITKAAPTLHSQLKEIIEGRGWLRVRGGRKLYPV
ncbi:hypothetical protein COT29_01355 [Candidatus Micrarchaeota archaeon CG08_land_8_20_14_0_20_59_11]|nr:MAG: hypothetical protein COT29_01355 [Candidatus Micrarchaeota archaeon CG08_land_8_20_14_0_20_59_11]